MPNYETHEVRLSELIKHYIADLPTPQGWQVLAIDLFTDVLVLKREAPENGSPGVPRNTEDSERIEAPELQPNQTPTQPENGIKNSGGD